MGYEHIRALISNLDLTWFRAKKKWFENETYYEPHKKTIYKVLQGKREMPMEEVVASFGETIIEKIDGTYEDEYRRPTDKAGVPLGFDGSVPYRKIIEIDLACYCWSDQYKDGRNINPDVDNDFPINGQDTAGQILSFINSVIETQDTQARYHIVLRTIETIEDAVKQMLQRKKNNEYRTVLEYFQFEFIECIRKEYHSLIQSNAMVGEYVEGLKFNLNQEELAALLYILTKAGFIYRPVPGDRSFLKFCSENFCYYIKGGFRIAKGLQYKYSDVVNSADASARANVFQQLKRTLSNMQKRGA